MPFAVLQVTVEVALYAGGVDIAVLPYSCGVISYFTCRIDTPVTEFVFPA